MKKLLFIVLAITTCYTINAQEDQTQNEKVKFGVKAGLNIANATGNGVDLFTDGKNSSSRLGISIGAVMEYSISDKFSLQPELFYSQQGFKGEDVTVKLDYINIPLLAKYNMSDEFSVLVGPQIGFLLSSKSDVKEIERQPLKSVAVETDLKEFFSKTDFGLNVGLAYQLDNGFGINTRYNLGLKDIFDFNSPIEDIQADKSKSKSQIAEDGDFVIKNSVFNLSIFYAF